MLNQFYECVEPNDSISHRPSSDLYDNPYGLFLYLFKDTMNGLCEFNKERYKSFILNIMNTQSESQSVTYRPLSLQDIYRFVGCIYIMDIYDLPLLEMYWGRRGSIVRFDCVANAFSYDRFSQLRHSLGTDDEKKICQNVCVKSRNLF